MDMVFFLTIVGPSPRFLGLQSLRLSLAIPSLASGQGLFLLPLLAQLGLRQVCPLALEIL